MTEPTPGQAPDPSELEDIADEPTRDGADEPRPPRGRRLGGQSIGWLVLLALIVAGVLIGQSVERGAGLMANPNTAAADAVHAAITALPPSSLVLVAMDGDLGTYPEIRATTRIALHDLLTRGASLAFVSVSVEGRAIAAAELGALRQAGSGERVLDLGFVTGAEAGMVRLVDGALPPGADGPLAALVAQRGPGIGAFKLILVVGGNDISPRSWVEQVGTRLPDTPMVAIAPTFAQPELAPYVRTGQLAGLLATIRDDAAYVQGVRGPEVTDTIPSSFAMRIGMIVALIVLLRQLARAVPRLGGGALAPEALDE